MEGIPPRVLAIHEAVTEACARAVSAKDRNTVFQQICNALVEREAYTAVSIGTVDRGLLKVTTIAQAGLLDFPAEMPISDMPEIERASPYVSNNLSDGVDTNVWAAEAAARGFLSLAVFPIKIANNVAALFSIYSRTEGAFVTEELAVVEELEHVISGTLVNMKLDGQRARAQSELQRREAIYSRILERAVGMVCEVDEHGIITFVSESQHQLLGFEPEVIMGKPFTEFVHPENVNLFNGLLKKVRQTESSASLELRMKRDHGDYLWVELVSDLREEDEEGRMSAFVIAIRDISSKKEQIETLQKRVNELNDHLRERNEKIKRLNEASSRRVGIVIKQINQISEIRDRLRKNPGFNSGYEVILKSAMRALEMDAGGIFVLNSVDKVIETRAMVPGRKSIVRNTYSPNESYLEFESLYKKEPISGPGGSGRSLLGTVTVHCSPICLSNSIRGFISLGSNSSRILDESDLSIFNLYSTLAAELLKSANLKIEPAREIVHSTERACRLESGIAYLIRDNVGLAYELFLEAIMAGTEGLCITRTMPKRIREKYNLQRTPIIWLTDEVVDGEKTIHSLQDLSILISNYVENATKPVILVDGIEYLISHKGFGSVYHLLQSKRTQMEANQGILIVPYFRDAMEPKEAKLLEREFRLFGTVTDAYGLKEGARAPQISNDIY